MDDIFEKASRKGLRFASPVGDLTTEQLWDLPLASTNPQKANLDALARGVSRELKGLEEESFVTLKPDPRKAELELRLAILKRVIEVKLELKARSEKAAENAERKRKLLAALASKEEADLAGMTKEEIEAEIAKLDA
jgi:hypothetical protein